MNTLQRIIGYVYIHLKYLSLLLSILPFLLISAYADTPTGAEKEVASSIMEMYAMARMIAIPLAVTGLTWSGIQLITNTDVATAARVKKQIIVICLALVALLLIPAVFKSGIGISIGWDPNNPAG